MLTDTGKVQWASRTLPVIVAFITCLISTDSVGQQQKPDLSGTWRLNLKASKLAPEHPRDTDTYQIKHTEPRIEVRHLFNGRSELYSYITDGKERIVNMSVQDGPLRAKASWDGDTLVIEKHQERGDTTWVSRYKLSQDAKTLELTQHVSKSALSSPFDESLFYEKQR